jgi:hypothetical protein
VMVELLYTDTITNLDHPHIEFIIKNTSRRHDGSHCKLYLANFESLYHFGGHG